MNRSSTRRKTQIIGLIVILMLVVAVALLFRFRGMMGCVVGIERETGMAGRNYYGFVHYKHYAGRMDLPAYLEKVQSVGAGWIQAEGPETASRSVAWDEVVPWEEDCDPANAPDLDDPSVYQWGSMDWVNEVGKQGLGAVIEISPGGGPNSTSCWTRSCKGGMCPPRDEHWEEWYTFVRRVVEHFDGTETDANGDRVPEVRYFTSVEEAGEGMPLLLTYVPFYGGSVEDLLGARLDRTEPRTPRVIVNERQDVGGSRDVPPGIVPVAYLAVEDANPEARYILGAVVGVAAKFSYAHLYTEWVNGKSDEALDALARSYNVRPASELRKPLGGPYTWEELFSSENSGLVKAQGLILSSFAMSEYYDAYGIHLYDSGYGFLHDRFPANDDNPNIAFTGPEGFQQVVRWLGEQTPRKVWITGTGLWPNPVRFADAALEEQLRYAAGHALKTLTVAHAAGAEWLTYSSIHHPGEYGGLADATWWGLWPYEAKGVDQGTEAAGAFARLARLIPTADCVIGKKVIEYREGARMPVRTDAADPDMQELPASDPWSGDGKTHTSAVLYAFELREPAPMDRVAVGWCVDQDPTTPETFEQDAACGQIEDICQTLGLGEEDPVSVYGVDGGLRQETACAQADVVFGQDPFVLAWGEPDTPALRVMDGKHWSEEGKAVFTAGELPPGCTSASTARTARVTPSGVLAVLTLFSPALWLAVLRRCRGLVQGAGLPAPLTRHTALPTSSATRSAPRTSRATPTGRPSAFPSRLRKPVSTSSGAPHGLPLRNGTKITL